MTISKAMSISGSGMHAERFRMDVISGNIANANTATRPGEAPLRRQSVVLRAEEQGVEIMQVSPDTVTPMRREYQPGHPYADAEGFVTFTNINPVFEMVDMLTASRAYEANLAAFNTARNMVNAALNIGRSA